MAILRKFFQWLFRRGNQWDSLDYGTSKADDDELNKLNGQL